MTIAANIGATAISTFPVACPDSVVAIRPVDGVTDLYWLKYALAGRQPDLDAMAGQNAQKNINLEILEKVAIAVPPTLEQHQIVTILEDSMGIARESDKAIELALNQSAAQRQNILRAAFSGQLVPQDPNDEPASVLLARIRAERAEREAVKKSQGHRSRRRA